MRNFDKRAASGLTYAMIIVLVLVVGLLVIFIMISQGLIEVEGSNEVVCKMSNKWSSTWTDWLIGGTLCKPSNKVVDPNDWSGCNPEFREAFLRAGDNQEERTKWAKHCVAEHVLKLVDKCYDLGGRGMWDPESFMCYTFAIASEKEAGELTEDALKKYAEDMKERIIAHLKEKTGVVPSKEFVNELAYLARDRKMYEWLRDYYIDRVYANVSICSWNGTDNFNISEQIGNDTSSASSILSGNIDTSRDGCGNVMGIIQPFLNDLNNVNNRIAALDKEIDALAIGHDPPIAPEVLDSEMMVVLSGDIDRISFDQAFLRKLAKELKMPERNITYASAWGSSKKLEILWDVDINQGTLYEMGFCNPDLDLGTGFYDTLVCSSIGRDAGQMVQIATAGMGAGGLLRTGSPYPGYCDRFSGYSESFDWVMTKPRDWCEKMQAVTGPGLR